MNKKLISLQEEIRVYLKRIGTDISDKEFEFIKNKLEDIYQEGYNDGYQECSNDEED